MKTLFLGEWEKGGNFFVYPKFLVRCWCLENTSLVFLVNDSGSDEEQESTVKRTLETRFLVYA